MMGSSCDYLPAICSFDVETSHILVDDVSDDGTVRKVEFPFVYHWQFGEYRPSKDEFKYQSGRRIEDFVKLMENYCPNSAVGFRAIVWVHNLNHEFSYISKLFNWVEVFSTKRYGVTRAVTDTNIEFRCSYALSKLSLREVGEALGIPKLELEYSKVRTPETELTKEEESYCERDVYIVCKFIAKLCGEEGYGSQNKLVTLSQIFNRLPLTYTGFVRRDIQRLCFGASKEETKETVEKMSKMRLKLDEYEMLKRAFSGGYTRARTDYAMPDYDNTPWYYDDMVNLDATSQYPTIIINNEFPMGDRQRMRKGKMTPEELDEFGEKRCWVAEVTFPILKVKNGFEPYILSSNCISWERAEFDKGTHGRLVYGEDVTVAITNVDFDIIRSTSCLMSLGQSEEIVKINRGYSYKKERLPKKIVEYTLSKYAEKTYYKDMAGFEAKYDMSKSRINSIGGMFQTDPIQLNQEFVVDESDSLNNHWADKEVYDNLDKDEKSPKLRRYNCSKSRFWTYQWGVWLTAYGRRTLWSLLVNLPSWVYCDTDGVVVKNDERTRQVIDWYNSRIREALDKTASHFGFDKNLFYPKNKHGEVKMLGELAMKERYDKFRCLGAKRYAYITNNQVVIKSSSIHGKNITDFLREHIRSIVDHKEEYDSKLMGFKDIKELLGRKRMKDSAEIKNDFIEMNRDFYEMIPDDYNEERDFPELAMALLRIGLYIPPEHSGRFKSVDYPLVREAEVTDYKGDKALVKSYGGMVITPVGHSFGENPVMVTLMAMFISDLIKMSEK